ncbi:MAG: hypothetical protein JO362_11485 [Streptomycetaceae bacterium]|nr:hypothetical protein [Streptomycetaceae bacterium]
MAQPDFTAAVERLLCVPRLEGTFRVHHGCLDLTDDFSEMRFKDPRLGGYLDRTRVEQHFLSAPLTVWIRGSWPGDNEISNPVSERNRWTVIVPPGAQLTVTSPRRSFTVVKALVGTMENCRPLASNGTLITGQMVELTAAATGLIAQLDWLYETSEVNLARATGTDLTDSLNDWHSAPLPELLERIRAITSRRRVARLERTDQTGDLGDR